MRGLRRMLLAVVITGAAAAMAVASAQTPTPTTAPTETPSPTLEPTASPSPTPYAGPTSIITIRFVSGGQQVSIELGSPVSAIVADGVQCRLPGFPAVIIQAIGYSTGWPLLGDPAQPSECAKGPPTNLRFEFASVNFGRLVVDIFWTGSAVTVDIELPPCPPTGFNGRCAFEGTVFTGVEGCQFVQTSAGQLIGPFTAQPGGGPIGTGYYEFQDGDRVRVEGFWNSFPLLPTFCSHPYTRFLFVLEDITLLPVELPITGGPP